MKISSLIPPSGASTSSGRLMLGGVALCVGVLLFLGERASRRGNSLVGAGAPTDAPRTEVPGSALEIVRVPEANVVDQQRNSARDALLKRWKHANFERRIRVDLPRALARRNVGAPDYNEMVVFRAEYGGVNFQRAHAQQDEDLARALAEASRVNPKWQDNFPGFWYLSGTVNRLQATSDTTPLAGVDGETVGAVASDVANLPGLNENLRDWMAHVERLTFGDEQAARQVEGLKSNEEVNRYLQAGAQDRYAAAYQQMLAAYPVEPSLRTYVDQQARECAVNSLTGSYVGFWNSEVYAITNDFEQWWRAVYRGFDVMQESRDVPEVREMLTDMQALKQEMEKSLSKANSESQAQRVGLRDEGAPRS